MIKSDCLRVILNGLFGNDGRTAPRAYYIVCLFSRSQFIVYDFLHSFFSIREAAPKARPLPHLG
jgi:hypothetical protein